MDAADVARLAAAIAKANGHSHPDDYAASVVKEWIGPTPDPAPAPAADVTEG